MQKSRTRKTGSSESSAVAPLANISQLSISNVKGFDDDFSLDIPKPPNDRAQWMVLIGENGVGKTTLLQCIALTLLGPWLNALLARSKVPTLVRMGSDIKAGQIDVTIAGQVFEVKVKAREGTLPDRIVADTDDKKTRLWPKRPAIFGYGVCRDSCPSTTAENLSSAPVNSVHTLFDPEKATMVDPSSFLRKLEGNATRSRVARLLPSKGQSRVVGVTPEERLYETVGNVFKEALRLKDLSVENDAVYVDHEEQGRVPLDALSSGYYAMARWLLDLLARYADFMTSNGQALVENFHLHMRAIVLVDEIDLYLHPSWQHRIIDDLRKLFPETTFVVTTHNPLCLLGALPGEIFVLRRNEETNRIESNQLDLPLGISPDEVLTGEWFELRLSETIDDDTSKLMEEHRRLLRKPKPRPHEQRRINEIEMTLTERLKFPFQSRSIRKLLWAASEMSKQERQEMDPLDKVSRMSKAELAELIKKARALANENEP